VLSLLVFFIAGGALLAFVREDAAFPRYVIPNTDEMEPGTFKDRVLVNTDPHLVLEGIILSAYAVGAEKGVFFIRPSYEMDAQLIERELEVARAAGFLGKNLLGSGFSFDMEVHRSAGRYICGEASAQVNAIMGLRAHPNKEVHMASQGLWGKPTIVNNVETLACVPPILSRGPEWFKGLARSAGGAGTKLYCVSGRVCPPGVFNKYYNPGTVNEISLFHNFDLTVDNQEFVSVVGSNGSGKTSMLNLICGSIPVDSGSITIDGTDITNMPEFKRQKRIGRVYQNPAMGTCPTMTILENMALADNKGKSFNLKWGTNKSRIDYYRESLKTLNLGLEDKIDIPVGSLSGGQRQAMALLMSTMTPIEFLILDEHTAALDPKTAELIMELTDKIVKEKNLTTIMVTHNLRYAVEYGNRLVMMHRGEVVIDKAGEDKRNLKIDDILDKFNEISIECGN
jgi:putative ABC transport system ATP-binding protein